MLVLKRNEGLACEVGQFEAVDLVLILDEMLAQPNVFLVEVSDLIRNVLQQSPILTR